MKKTWEKPQLIVVYRGKPEEAVLSVCKNDSSTGPVPANNQCYSVTRCIGTCGTQCSDFTSS